MGFTKVVIPKHNASQVNPKDYDIEIIPVSTLKQAFAVV